MFSNDGPYLSNPEVTKRPRVIPNKYNDNKEVPMCIIGGINKKNILSVSKYQPDMIAISDGIFNQDVDNIKKIINELQRVMNEKK